MTQVFLNYRSVDEPLGVGMLDQILSDRFGSSTVFFASKSIELGAQWESRMFDAVRDSVAVLVVMGRFWLNASDEAGVRLLDKQDDFVRREILLGMQENKLVIPVRLGVPNLRSEDLPEVLRPLSALQSITIQYRSTGPDIDRLVTKLRELIPQLRTADKLSEPGQPHIDNKPSYVNNAETVTQTIVNAERFRTGTFHAGPRFG